MADTILIQNGIPVGFWNQSNFSYAELAMENYGGILGDRNNFEVRNEIEKMKIKTEVNKHD